MKIKNIFLMCSSIFLVFSFAEEVPKELVEGLASEKFKRREESQQVVEKWANEKGPAAVSAIYKLYISSEREGLHERWQRLSRSSVGRRDDRGRR
jgi:hypothetical protein